MCAPVDSRSAALLFGSSITITLDGSCDGGGRGGCGRLWNHAAQVPAVFRVHHRASDFVHRQSAGHFSRYAQCPTAQGSVPVVVQPQVLGQGTGLSRGPSSHVSQRRLSDEFLFLGFLLALFALGNYGASFPYGLASGSHASCVWVFNVEYRIRLFVGFCGYSGAMLGSTVDTCSSSVLGAFGRFAHIFCVDVDSEPEVFFLLSHAEWRSVLSRYALLALGN